MPTYQYVCTECGEPLEVVQKFSDDPLTVCPACQGRLRKVFSPVGIVFKGSGFYRNDSRSSSSSMTPAPAAASSASKSTSDSGSSDSSTSAASSSDSSSASNSSKSGSSKSESTSAPAAT